MIPSIRDSLTAFYHRLIRSKLLQQPSFGQPSWGYRVLHLGPLYGLIFATPALATMAWYSGLTVSSHVRHNRANHLAEPLTKDLFQIHLHDRLTADYRRLAMPEPLASSELPTYGLFLTNDKFDRLDSMLPPEEGKASYVDALLQNKNKLYNIELRYRGTKPWHWNYPQKSWKVRVKSDKVMLDGLPTFNFINTPDPMPFNEQMVLDTAREVGLLTPAYYPFRLLINNAYLGVYFFEGQADEGLLRRERRMPGSIYSGAGAPINPKTKVSSLWESASHWNRVETIGQKPPPGTPELTALLDVINSKNSIEFAAFATTALDVDKFAALDAVDVVFGNEQHDFNQNHKLYFDPYKNRFEPIATDFRDMQHERTFNRTENPLLLRLKELPEYVSLRNRKVYDLLKGSCADAALGDRVDHWIERLRPDQERDPYWDAYELLPAMGTYYRQLVRPMTGERQRRAADVRLNELRERSAYLRYEIEQLDVSARLYRPAVEGAGQPKPSSAAKSASSSGVVEAVLDVSIDGQAGFEWLEAVPETTESCSPTEWQLFADRDLDDAFTEGKDLRLVAVEAPLRLGKPDVTLYPGVELVEINPSPNRGRVRSEQESRTYRFFIRATGCMPDRWRLIGRNTATLGAMSLEVEAKDGTAPELDIACDEDSGFLEPEYSSLHPFCYPLVADETVRIGPGVVKVDATRIYSAHQTVVIEPGTTMQMAEGASIITYGRFIAEGQPGALIRFVPQGNSWGGIALQGSGTNGSRFSNVEIDRGTRPALGFFDFPGTVSVHDSRDVRFDDVSWKDNQTSPDALHVAYVQDLEMADVSFAQVAQDAIALDYSVAKVERLSVRGAGNHGIVSMGSRVEVSDSIVDRCKKSALSAGERSDVVLQRSLLSRSSQGLVLKNASAVTTKDALLYHDQVAVRQEAEAEWYPGSSSLSVESTFATDSETVLDGAKKPKSGSIKTELHDGSLEALRQRVLGDQPWSKLKTVLKAESVEKKP